MPTLLLGGVGRAGRALGDVFGLAVIVPTTNAWMLGASRIVLATTRESLLPERLQRRSARTGAPIGRCPRWGTAQLGHLCGGELVASARDGKRRHDAIGWSRPR